MFVITSLLVSIRNALKTNNLKALYTILLSRNKQDIVAVEWFFFTSNDILLIYVNFVLIHYSTLKSTGCLTPLIVKI